MVSRFLAAALALALTGPGFDGCQGGPPPGGSVPPGTTVACFTDADCPTMGCADVRCIASQCMTVATMIDGDHDGHAPPPCGDDCDDTDSRVFPGEAEICDGRDQDCDMIIDEDALPGVIATVLGTASDQISAAPIGTSMVITDTGFASGVRLRIVDFAAHVGAAVPVLADPIEVVDLAPTTAGGLTVVGRVSGSGHVIETYPIEISGGVLVVHPVSTLVTLADGAQAMRVQAEPVGDSFVVVWDDPAGDRWAIMPSWTAAVHVLSGAAGSAPMDVASDGTSIVIPSSPSTVSFFAATDGSDMGSHTFMGGLADDPVTTAAHDYIVAFHDAFDHELAHVTPATVQPMHAAPSQGSGLPLRVDETAFGPLVTRFDATNTHMLGTGVWALVLPETLDSVLVDFNPMVVSAGVGGAATDFDVVSSPAGTAVVTNFGTHGAVLAVLACQP